MSPRRSLRVGGIVLLALVAASAAAPAQQPITRMSVDSSGAESDDDSAWSPPAISGDGRYVAFASYATNLVAGDTNGETDVFVKEVATGVLVRVSVDSSGVQGNRNSYSPAISSTGRFVAFTSLASNLVAGDTNGDTDVFVHDRDPDGNGIFDEGNGITFRVSIRTSGLEANSASGHPSISDDGSQVAFDSGASNLVVGDTNRVTDVFVRDWVVSQTTRVSVDSSGVQGDGESAAPSISRNGNVVGFHSFATNLVAHDVNNQYDVFVRDRSAGATEIVSVDSSGIAADKWSFGASLSDDGQFVAFYSWSDNLVAGDTNSTGDVFLRDRAARTTERVSVDSAGNEADGPSFSPAVSPDGTVVAYESGADNLVANDGNGLDDLFVRDRSAGTTSVVSMSCLGEFGDGFSTLTAITSDNRFVAFASYADNLIANDTNGFGDVLLLDRSVNQDASRFNYGGGYPGTLGVPTLLASADPVFGTTLDIDVGNSLGANTPALLLAGFGQASIPTSAGGTLLVDFVLMTPIVVLSGGDALSATIPSDFSLCGVQVDLQVLEIDAGAAHGISFTQGLDLVLGR